MTWMDLDSTTTSPATSTMDLGPGVVLLGDRGRGSVEVYRLPGKLVAATKEEEVGRDLGDVVPDLT